MFKKIPVAEYNFSKLSVIKPSDILRYFTKSESEQFFVKHFWTTASCVHLTVA